MGVLLHFQFFFKEHIICILDKTKDFLKRRVKTALKGRRVCKWAYGALWGCGQKRGAQPWSSSEGVCEPFFFNLQLRSHLFLLWNTVLCILSSDTRAITPISSTLATSQILRESWGTLATRRFVTMLWIQGDLTSSAQSWNHFISCSDMLCL